MADGAEALGLERLVVEELHRVVVDQAIGQPPLGVGVELVHAALVDHAARREYQGEAGVEQEGDEDDAGKAGRIAAEHDAQHEGDLDQGRHDGEQADAQQEGDAAGAAVDIGQQAAELAPRMEARAEGMQVLEGLARVGRDGLERYPHEQQVAPFVEQGRGKAQQRIADQQIQRQAGGQGCAGQRVDDALEQQRDRHRGQLGGQQQDHGRRDAPAVAARYQPKLGADAPLATAVVCARHRLVST